MLRILTLISFLLGTSIVSSPAFAQTEIPGDTAPAGPTGTVRGTIANLSPDGAVPGQVEIMLHGWDQNNTDQVMTHGQSRLNGTFVLEEVALNPTLTYAVMATYQGTAYYSSPAQVTEGQTRLELEVPVYEATTDLSQVQIEQMHVLFYFDQAGLGVSEIYILSNLGKYTVKDAKKLADGTPVTVKFPLPAEAANVSFGHGEDGRFLQYPGGYADTSPILPGLRSSQTMVSYVLPYGDGMSYSFTPTLPVSEINFLFPKDSGMTVQGAGLAPAGEWPLQDGSAFLVLSRSGVEPGEQLSVAISGQPKTGMTGSTATGSVGEKVADLDWRKGMGIGGMILGLALVVLGVWWWRRPQAGLDEYAPASIEEGMTGNELGDLISEVARLDQAYEGGTMDESTHRIRREDLVRQIKAAAQAQSPFK